MRIGRGRKEEYWFSRGKSILSEWWTSSPETLSEAVRAWAEVAVSGEVESWKKEERLRAVERVLAWAVSELNRLGRVIEEKARPAYPDAYSVQELSRGLAEIRARLERLEEAEKSARIRELEDRLKDFSARLVEVEREVAALILSRGLQGSQLIEDYLKWFAEEMIRAAGEAAHLIGEIADPSAPIGTPLKKISPEEAAAALKIIAKQRIHGLTNRDKKHAKKLASLGLLKKIPGERYAPTKFLKGLCAAALAAKQAKKNENPRTKP